MAGIQGVRIDYGRSPRSIFSVSSNSRISILNNIYEILNVADFYVRLVVTSVLQIGFLLLFLTLLIFYTMHHLSFLTSAVLGYYYLVC